MPRSDKQVKIICLTPVKNESWILDKFLKSASLWADHIIVADQMSTDGSRDICRNYEKVILLDNPAKSFNEYEMRILMFNEARKIEGPRLLLSLDADEMFTPNYESIEWDTMIKAKPGTILQFPWVNLNAGLNDAWFGGYNPVGYMDDNIEFKTGLIHTPRIPMPSTHDILELNEVKILHFQYIDESRVASKQRWYQCFEKINIQNRRAVSLFRRYHHMYESKIKFSKEECKEWCLDYEKVGIDMSSITKESMFWWDKKVLDYMDEYGADFFAHLDIWTVNWMEIAQKWNMPDINKYQDPRSIFEKMVNRWLLYSQRKKNNLWIKQIDKIINYLYK